MFGQNKRFLKEKKEKEPVFKKAQKAVPKTDNSIPDLIVKSFVEGCLVLGCVHDIKQSELVVSLPGVGNYGYVKLNNISSIYSGLLKSSADGQPKAGAKQHATLFDMYRKGNLIRCKVIGFNNQKLYLTIEPNQVNSGLTYSSLENDMVVSGAVKSKEDHGYTIDLGINELTGFIHKKTAKNLSLSLGQCCLFKVVDKSSMRAISLKFCEGNESFYDLKHKNKFDTYLPGCQLTCNVEKASKNGVQANVTAQLFAYVLSTHVPMSKNELFNKKAKKDDLDDEKRNCYVNGDKITGTVIFINPYSKVIYLSLLPHLVKEDKVAKVSSLFLNDDQASQELRLGRVIEDAQVIVHTQKGIYVRFKIDENGKEKQVVGFIPKRHLFSGSQDGEKDDDEDEAEEKEVDGVKLKKVQKDSKNMNKEDLEKQFPLNAKIKARIYDFSLLEDLVLLSCRESVMEAAYMSHSELRVGQVVKGVVKGVHPTNGGVMVTLSEFVSGFIPKIHTADVPLSEALLTRKLKPGSEVKCKIIHLDTDEKRCILTAKKTLIKSKLPAIDSYDELSVGMETYGVVVSIQKYGLMLGFMNEICGLLPRNQISTSAEVRDENKDLAQLYYVGQVIKCNVLSFDAFKRQLKLSLIMDDSQIEKAPKKKKADEEAEDGSAEGASSESLAFEVGDLIPTGTIIQVNQEKFFFKVRIPARSKDPKSRPSTGIIFKNQLSDTDSLNDLLFELYRRKMSIDNLMITHYGSSDAKSSSSVKDSQSKQCHYLTAKASVIGFYTRNKDSIPRSLKEISPKKWLVGWIRRVLPNGLLVELPNNLVGFSSSKEVAYFEQIEKQMALRASSALGDNLTIGQAVLAQMNKLYEDKCTLKTRTRFDLSEWNKNDRDLMLQIFRSYLDSTKQLFQSAEELKASESTETPAILRQIALTKIKIGSVVNVAVKSFNEATRRVECIFMDELELNKNELGKCVLAGSAFVESEDDEYKVGAKLKALVVGFDSLSGSFCLVVDKKKVKTYSKNFSAEFAAQVQFKEDQLVKGEILYVSQWFCVLGLKAHALGKLAVMPLFKNNFTQLHTTRAQMSNTDAKAAGPGEQLELSVKRKQLVDVSSLVMTRLVSSEDKAKGKKSDERFKYFAVGDVIKVSVKHFENTDMVLVCDGSSKKQKKKEVLKLLAVLNENPNSAESGPVIPNGIKRKLDATDNETIVITKKVSVESEKEDKKRKRKNSDKGGADFIEIVADVKKSKKEDILTLEKVDVASVVSKSPAQTNGSEPEEAASLPWEVADFDQLNEIIGKKFKQDTEGKENRPAEAMAKTNGEKEEPKSKKKVNFVDDRSLYEIEEKLLDSNREPETADDFERLVVSRPNSSMVWIQYMAFYLQMAEVDKAREIANRALKTIIYRDENERLNVWVALLNLENLYGSTQSMEETFNKATQNCDSFKVHCHLAEIYARAGKQEEAESVYLKMTRKFGKLQDTWTKYAVYHYKNKNFELARKLMLKSLQSLDKPEHIEIISKFAQLEFKFGDIERAKAVYDSLFFTYPNRTDMWSVYIDMLVKHQRFDDARQIFNRIVQLGLTPKRMKFIFKKYMDFEKAHGTPELVEKVKETAVKYVESSPAGAKENSKPSTNGKNIEQALKKSLNL